MKTTNKYTAVKDLIQNLLFQKCKIEPLENLEGIITSVLLNGNGFQFHVRYYIDGEQKTEWFYDFEILI